MVVDPFGRPLRNLRVSVNKACNLSCTYCHLEGGAMAGGDVTPAEFQTLCGIAAELGCTDLKITGGEPTLRTDLEDILHRVAPMFDDVSMTTNGLLLDKRARSLRRAGLDRVNISIDTLDPERYRGVTRGGDVHKVVTGIRAARAVGLAPIKLNMVVLRGFNDDEVDAMIAFAADEGVGLQLIELHTDRTNAAGIAFKESFLSLDAIEKDLAARAGSVTVAPQHARPRYVLHEARRRLEADEPVPALRRTVVEVVRPYGNEDFCAHCHRLRLTGDGLLKPCLMVMDNYVDVVGPLRAGASRDELRALFLEANARRAPYWPAPMQQARAGHALPSLRMAGEMPRAVPQD